VTVVVDLGVTTDRRRQKLIVIALLIGVAATSFPTTLLAASIETIRLDFDSDLATISWVQVAPSLGFALGMPMFGKLGDLYGHRRVYVIGFGVSTAFSLLTALAWSPLSLILARTISQLGGGATGTAAIALVAGLLPADQRSRSFGILNMAGGLAPVLGVVVGGPAVDAIGWRALFVLAAIPAGIAWVLGLFVLGETTKRPDVTFDTWGGLALGAGATALLFGINRIRPWGIAHPVVIVCFVLTPVLIVAFVRIERRVQWPLLPLRYLRERSFTASTATMFFMQASFIGSFMLAPLMVMRLFHYSVSRTSLVLMSRPLGFAIGAWVAGHHHSTRSMRKFQLYGNGLLIVGSVFMVLGPLGRSLWLIEVGLVITGFSNGYSRTVLSSLVLTAVDDTDVGIATGVLNMTSQLGSAIGTTVMSAIIANSVEPSTMGWAFGAALIVALLTVPATALHRARAHAT